MIIEPTEITAHGVTGLWITHNEPYYGVIYYEETKEVVNNMYTPYEGYPITDERKIGGLKGLYDGFAATEWQEFLDELDNRGIVLPEISE